MALPVPCDGKFCHYSLYDSDAFIRYAFSGNDPGEFEKIAERLFRNSLRNIDDAYYAMFAAAILYRLKKYEMLDILIRMSEQAGKEYEHEIGPETFREIAADSEAVISGGEFKGKEERAIFTRKMFRNKFGEFTNGDLYFAMIAGNLKRAREIIEKRDIFLDMEIYMNSAIAFRNTGFLKTAFECGVRLFPENIADFCTDREAIKFLCDNFPEYVLTIPHKNTKDVSANFILHTVAEDELLSFAVRLLRNAGQEIFNKVFDKLPKISIMKEDDLAKAYCLKIKDHTCLRNVLVDEAVCMVSDGEIVLKMPKYLDFVYDFSDTNEPCFENCDSSRIIDFLGSHNCRFPREELTPAIKLLLDRNNEYLTKLMISKNIINRANLDKVAEYLAIHKFYTALNEVNQAEIPP